jgi:chromate transport protein ChrA
VVKLIRGFYKDMKALAIFSVALALSAVLGASPVLLVIAAGFAGFLLYRPQSGKPGDRASGGGKAQS